MAHIAWCSIHPQSARKGSTTESSTPRPKPVIIATVTAPFAASARDELTVEKGEKVQVRDVGPTR